MFNYRSYIPAVFLLIGCAFVWNAHSQRAMPLAAPLSTILPAMPGYTVQDQKVTDEERRIAGMSDYVARAYSRDTTVAFTTFVSYYERQTQGKTIHSPRNCLPGAGWEIVAPGTATIQIDGRPEVVNRYVLKNQSAMAVVYYWYQGRGRVVANEYRVKANLLRDAALAGHTEEALVRVVVPVQRGSAPLDSPEAKAQLDAAMALGASVAEQLGHEVWRTLPRAG
jgi:EpsI family protein